MIVVGTITDPEHPDFGTQRMRVVSDLDFPGWTPSLPHIRLVVNNDPNVTESQPPKATE